MKKIGIIGAGRFGMSMAQALSESGVEVVLMDRNGSLVQSASSIVTHAVQGDATNARALEESGIGECDVAVVAIGSNIEASTLATANCKDLGVNEVIAKATSDLHGKILKKIGADQVIFPDRDSAHRLARSIIDHGAFDLLELSEGCSIAEIDVPESCVDKTLAETDLRKKTGVTVLCIRRPAANPKKPRELLIPTPTEKILAGDRLIVFGSTKQIDDLSFEKK
jgi:trk system potassium uptake protein TrkA